MDYFVKGVKYDSNTVSNQQIKEAFVREHVLCNVTNLMRINNVAHRMIEETDYRRWNDIDFLPYSPEDIQNYQYEECEECGSDDLKIDGDEYVCMGCGYASEECSYGIHEIPEWWVVSSLLGDMLLEKKKVILKTNGYHVWGRQGTGQSIILDSIIDRICINLEILENQNNEFKWRR